MTRRGLKAALQRLTHVLFAWGALARDRSISRGRILRCAQGDIVMSATEWRAPSHERPSPWSDDADLALVPYFSLSAFLSIFPTLVLGSVLTNRIWSGIPNFEITPASAKARRCAFICVSLGSSPATAFLIDERQGSLAPFVVLDADDGGFRHSLALRYEIFDLQR